MTVADASRCGRHSGPGARPGRGVRDRPGRPTGRSSRACSERIEGYQRRVEERVATLGGEVVSGGPRRHGRRARAPRATASPSAQVDLVLCHAVTYATSSRCCPPSQAARGAGRAARAAARRRRSTTPTPTRASGWPTARPAACPEIAGAFTRARHPLRHRRRHDRRRRARVGEDRRAGCAPPASPAALRRARDRLPRAHLSRHARHVLRLHRRARPARRARRGARDRRPRRARGAAPPTTRSRPSSDEIRAMFDFADPSDDPIAGPIEPTSSSTGRRASPSASTGSPPTSSSTR